MELLPLEAYNHWRKPGRRMVKAFRLTIEADSPFGRQLMSALHNALEHSNFNRTIGYKVFLFTSSVRGLGYFYQALHNEPRKTRDFYPQFNQVMRMVDQSQSMLIVQHRGYLYVLGSSQINQFDQVPARPRRARKLLKSYRGDDCRTGDGSHLTPAHT